jgi:hypothetical protein
MQKILFKISKSIHKYVGLLLILFVMWMSISGILLNHPHWIANISVPGWLIPSQYVPKNWNRSSLTSAVFSKQDPSQVFFAGKQGIWCSTDGGTTFQRFEQGFEKSAYYKKTKQLLLLEEPEAYLLAATDGGLYQCFLKDGVWRSLPLGNEREAVRKMIKIRDKLLVFTESNMYKSFIPRGELQFQKIKWLRQEGVRQVTLVDLFFHLHGGSIWGLPGKLLFDFTGLVIFFLAVSAFYIWYFPRKLKKPRSLSDKIKIRKKAGPFRLFFRYHRKLGIWLAAVLLIIGGTAFFMRPPTLVLIASGSIPATYYPGFLPDNAWEGSIHNVLYDPIEDILLVNTKEGEWQGPADFSEPFIKTDIQAPIFVMGATVFDTYNEGGYLIGSFSGIFHQERLTKKSFDLVEQRYVQDWSNVRPATHMVTGYFQTPTGDEYITTHEQGLLPLQENRNHPVNHFKMPRQLQTELRISLWNYMFELHNGRIFRDWIGGLYILIIPLGSLLFILITLSGIYDWIYIKIIHHNRIRKRVSS